MHDGLKRSWPLVALAIAGCGLGVAPGSLLGSDPSSLSAQGTAPVRQLEGARQQVRLQYRSPAQLDDLARHGVDLFENPDGHAVDASVDARGLAYLQLRGVPFAVTRSAATLFGVGMPGGYHTVATLDADLEAIAQKYPQVAHLSTIGTSLEGRPILAIELTSHPGQGPAVLFDGGQHARELPPVEIMDRFANLLASSYGTDPAITKLLDGRDIWIVPEVNPDGRIHVEAGDSMWRKNARDNGDGTFGVDTNRNLDDHWSEGDHDTGEDDYGGKSPVSEPETQAMRDLCVAHKFTLSVDMHNYAGMILWPPGYSSALPPDQKTFAAIASHIAPKIGYKAGTIARSLYNTYGDFSTWQYDQLGTIALGVELADPGFDAPYSQVDTDWQAWEPNLLWLAQIGDDPRHELAGS